MFFLLCLPGYHFRLFASFSCDVIVMCSFAMSYKYYELVHVSVITHFRFSIKWVSLLYKQNSFRWLLCVYVVCRHSSPIFAIFATASVSHSIQFIDITVIFSCLCCFSALHFILITNSAKRGKLSFIKAKCCEMIVSMNKPLTRRICSK